MHISVFYKCAYMEGKMCIYESSLLYMCILASVNVHIRKPKYEYTEALFRTCGFWLSYMRIYGSQNANIWVISSIYASSLSYMHIYERESAYLCFHRVWLTHDPRILIFNYWYINVKSMARAWPWAPPHEFIEITIWHHLHV